MTTSPSPFRPDALAGQRILITGGGSGLGRGLALHLAAHGAEVHLWGRRAGMLREAVEEIAEATGAQPRCRVVDVRDAAAVDDAIGSLWEEDGPLTGVVNNAAGNFIARTEDLSPRAFTAITETVMNGSYNVTHAVGRRWIAEGLPGAVLSTLVSWVFTGSAYVVPSAMAKSAVHAMTMSLAVEWARHGIRLNAIAPGPIPTEYTSVVLSSSGGERGDRGAMTDLDAVPARRAGTVEEFSHLATFLLSGACDYLTGQTITMDGGQMLAGPSTFSALAELTDDEWARIAEQGRRAAAASKEQRG